MKPKWRLSIVLAAVLFAMSFGMAGAGQEFKVSAYNLPMSVMSQQEFQKNFAGNRDIPRDHGNILALARKLYLPLEEKFLHSLKEFAPVEESDPGCREYELGLLFAALQNPDVSDTTRAAVNDIIELAVPPLPKSYTSGNFKILYTTSDANPLHNVTDAEAQSVALYLNYYYAKYLTNFKRPKSYWSAALGKYMIDVKIYYIDASTLGQTGSSWNHLELNASSCVKNFCKRRTTSAHELFHRVQYSYGYVTGTANMGWIVEGTAAWSQKYCMGSVRDYMQRMNSGLSSPDKKLITAPSARSYDACHFWVYLDELATKSTYPASRAIRDIWATYSTNGKNAKAAVQTVTNLRTGNPTFDNFVIKWHRANYCKDFTNASSSWKHDYTEDETTTVQCSTTYGPLSHVPKTTKAIAYNNTAFTLTGSVSEYGADYYEFLVGSSLTNLKIVLDGINTGNFSYEFIPIKSGKVLTYSYTYTTDYTYSKTLTAGQYDKLGLIVVGLSKGGTYSIKVGP